MQPVNGMLADCSSQFDRAKLATLDLEAQTSAEDMSAIPRNRTLSGVCLCHIRLMHRNPWASVDHFAQMLRRRQ